MPSIDIDDEVYDRLKHTAEPFVDTPNSVLRRVLGLDPNPNGASGSSAIAKATTARAPAKLQGAATTGARKRSRTRRKSHKKERTRVPAGSILQEDAYELPLIQALVQAGGEGSSKEITRAVGSKLDSKLTALDREPLASGAIRWENRLQFVRLKLIERGLMRKDTPRGIWAITEEGRKAIEKS